MTPKQLATKALAEWESQRNLKHDSLGDKELPIDIKIKSGDKFVAISIPATTTVYKVQGDKLVEIKQDEIEKAKKVLVSPVSKGAKPLSEDQLSRLQELIGTGMKIVYRGGKPMLVKARAPRSK